MPWGDAGEGAVQDVSGSGARVGGLARAPPKNNFLTGIVFNLQISKQAETVLFEDDKGVKNPGWSTVFYPKFYLESSQRNKSKLQQMSVKPLRSFLWLL